MPLLPRCVIPAVVVAVLGLGPIVTAAPADYFAIRVVDQDTGRGVPLVELKTTNEVKYYTDSNGFIAFLEPGLMGQEVFFHVKSHGYEYPKDAFGYRGVRLKPLAGGKAMIKVKRVNVAERLYRITGQGVYRDSVLLGEPVPTVQPTLNGQVMGQDTVMTAVYRGEIFWLWGDTNRAGYALGNFSTTCATSKLPGRPGGLDPAAGVNLHYFQEDPSGFTRKMVPDSAVPVKGLKWVDALVLLKDPTGRERLVGRYAVYKDLANLLARGLVVFNDDAGTFDELVKFDLACPMFLEGHPYRAETAGSTYLYNGFGPPYAVRVPADWKAVQDPAAYEGFTSLLPGGRFDGDKTKLDRGPDGKLIFGWKKDTPPLAPRQQERLVRAGLLKADEAWSAFRDVESGKPVRPHGGSVSWSPYRRRWQTVFTQSGGTSALGEIWYAEADTPAGPWGYARKVLTHEKYTFYNPAHHPFFDQDGGRTIYFEGTYTAQFSGNTEHTPWYEYNQIMHRLDLADPRLTLPAPVYRVRGEGGPAYLTREGVEDRKAWARVEEVAFFAIPPGRPRGELVPVYAAGGAELRTTPPADGKAEPLFFVPADDKAAGAVPLYEFRNADGGRRYSSHSDLPGPNWRRTERPVCHVWGNPPGPMTFDRDARPVPTR